MAIGILALLLAVPAVAILLVRDQLARRRRARMSGFPVIQTGTDEPAPRP